MRTTALYDQATFTDRLYNLFEKVLRLAVTLVKDPPLRTYWTLFLASIFRRCVTLLPYDTSNCMAVAHEASADMPKWRSDRHTASIKLMIRVSRAITARACLLRIRARYVSASGQ